MCLKDLTPDQKFSWIYLEKNSSNAKKKKKKLTEQNKKWKPVLVKVHSLQNFLFTGVSLITVNTVKATNYHYGNRCKIHIDFKIVYFEVFHDCKCMAWIECS